MRIQGKNKQTTKNAATKPRLVFGLRLIGLEEGASFVDQSQGKVQNG